LSEGKGAHSSLEIRPRINEDTSQPLRLIGKPLFTHILIIIPHFILKDQPQKRLFAGWHPICRDGGIRESEAFCTKRLMPTKTLVDPWKQGKSDKTPAEQRSQQRYTSEPLFKSTKRSPQSPSPSCKLSTSFSESPPKS